MISSFRKLSKSWVAPIIVGLIAISFIIVGGMTDLFSGGNRNGPVVKAGSREISQVVYRRIVDQQVAAYR